MTRYFVAGLSRPQREAFEQIAIGDGLPRANKKTLVKLLERGLIERGEDKVLGRDCFGSITIPQYYVPIPIHKAWCGWCSQHVEPEEAA